MTITAFDLVVPQNSAQPISKVVALLTLQDDAPATFTITDPTGAAFAFPAMAVGGTPAPHNYPPVPPANRQARVVIERLAAPAGDPIRNTSRITFNLNTDFNPTDCSSALPLGTSETWHVAVAGTEITGIAQISLTPRVSTGCIG